MHHYLFLLIMVDHVPFDKRSLLTTNTIDYAELYNMYCGARLHAIQPRGPTTRRIAPI